MFKWILAIGGVVLVLVFGATLLINAQASLAQAHAMSAQAEAIAFQSATNLAAQCMLGLVAVLALAAGVGLGRGWSKIESGQKKHRERAWLPGPNAPWQQRRPQTQQTALPRPYLPQPRYYTTPVTQQPQVYLISEAPDSEDSEDILFTDGWGI